MAKLSVIEGQTDAREYLLTGDAVLGRSPECEVVLPGPLCSRHHARITCRDGVYYIEDLGSANGTLVNGSFEREARLSDGDWIAIGDYRLTFLLDDDYVPPQQAFLVDPGTPTIVNTLDIEERIARVEIVDSAAVQRLRTHLAILKEVAERACGALEMDRLVHLVLKELLKVYTQADNVYAVFFGFGEQGEDLRWSASRQGGLGTGRGMSQTLLRMATGDRTAILAADAASDARFEGAQSIVQQNLRSMMCCPLLVRGAVVGAVQADTCRANEPFTASDLQLLVTIAGQMAVAAENARMHRQLMAQQRLAAVGQAVGSLAHCIKNVINGLAGGSYILELGLRKQDPDRTAKGWEMVKRNTGFMSELVRDMLAYCRRAPLRREPTDIAGLLDATLLMVQETAAQRGVDAVLAADESLPSAPVDPVALKRVFLNLLTNAIEACSEGCRVEVRAEAAGEDVLRITVADDGPGIPKDVLPRLFEPFFTTKGSQGTGLGLALVKKVVGEHGGRVEVVSEVGHGTAFHVFIPRLPQEQETTVK